ncbi:MAG: hypothetical protein IJO60_02160 [Agathobacter sp.]|nr:hypothetical protein [Agathobacter sp.]
MKKALLSTFYCIIILIFTLIFLSLYSRIIRYTEIRNALELSMQQAIAQLQLDENRPSSEEEWLSIFANSVSSQIQSKSDLEIRIYTADFEKGLLSAEAILTYQNLIGSTSSVSTGKRVILLETYYITQQ